MSNLASVSVAKLNPIWRNTQTPHWHWQFQSGNLGGLQKVWLDGENNKKMPTSIALTLKPYNVLPGRMMGTQLKSLSGISATVLAG